MHKIATFVQIKMFYAEIELYIVKCFYNSYHMAALKLLS